MDNQTCNLETEELPDFPFPLFVDYTEIEDFKLKNKLPIELFLRHEGYEVDSKWGRLRLTIINYTRPNNSLFMDIYRECTHFYGNFSTNSLMFKDVAGNCHIGTGLGVPHVGLGEITLHRRLTEEDFLKDPERFKLERIGDWTNAFNTSGSLVERAEFIAKRHFPGFQLIIPKEVKKPKRYNSGD